MSAFCYRSAIVPRCGAIIELFTVPSKTLASVFPEKIFDFTLRLELNSSSCVLFIEVEDVKYRLGGDQLHFFLLGATNARIESNVVVLRGTCTPDWAVYHHPPLTFNPIWTVYYHSVPADDVSVCSSHLIEYAMRGMKGERVLYPRRVIEAYPPNQPGITAKHGEAKARKEWSYYPNQIRGLSFVGYQHAELATQYYLMDARALTPHELVDCFPTYCRDPMARGFVNLFVRAFNPRPHILFPSDDGLQNVIYLPPQTSSRAMMVHINHYRSGDILSGEDCTGHLYNPDRVPTTRLPDPIPVAEYSTFLSAHLLRDTSKTILRSGCLTSAPLTVFYDIGLAANGASTPLPSISQTLVATKGECALTTSPVLPGNVSAILRSFTSEAASWWSALYDRGLQVLVEEDPSELLPPWAVWAPNLSERAGSIMRLVRVTAATCDERDPVVKVVAPTGAGDWQLVQADYFVCSPTVFLGLLWTAFGARCAFPGARPPADANRAYWRFTSTGLVNPTFNSFVLLDAALMTLNAVHTGEGVWSCCLTGLDIKMRDPPLVEYPVALGQLSSNTRRNYNAIAVMHAIMNTPVYRMRSHIVGAGLITVAYESEQHRAYAMSWSGRFMLAGDYLLYANCSEAMSLLASKRDEFGGNGRVGPITFDYSLKAQGIHMPKRQLMTCSEDGEEICLLWHQRMTSHVPKQVLAVPSVHRATACLESIGERDPTEAPRSTVEMRDRAATVSQSQPQSPTVSDASENLLHSMLRELRIAVLPPSKQSLPPSARVPVSTTSLCDAVPSSPMPTPATFQALVSRLHERDAAEPSARPDRTAAFSQVFGPPPRRSDAEGQMGDDVWEMEPTFDESDRA